MNHSNTAARVLALDIATTTGWATIANGVITSGSQDFHRRAATKKRMEEHSGQSFASFRRWLHAKVIDDKPCAIVYEEVMRWAGAKAAHAFCGYRGLMLEAGTIFSLPCYPYSVGTVKKTWTGSGNAKKPQMMAECLRRFPGLDLTDENEADALAILHLHLSTVETK